MATAIDKSGNSPIGKSKDVDINKLRSVRVTSTGQAIPVNESGRLYSLYAVASSSSGSIIIRSGDSNGDIIGEYGTANFERVITTDFGVSGEENGLAFTKGCHVTLNSVNEVTLVYKVSIDTQKS